MTENESGRCVIIPLRGAGIIAMFMVGAVLIGIGTFGGVDGASAWGVFCSVLALAWTVVYVSTRQHRMLMYAFEVGRETGERGGVNGVERSMRPVP